MVVKTDTCSFSEFKIFPGRGSRFVRKDGTLQYFISNKCKSLYLQRKKPSRLTWTLAWRRMNKKLTSFEATRRRRVRRAVKAQRAVGGVAAEEIRQRRTQKPEARQAAREAALREVKLRQQARSAAPRTGGRAAPAAAAAKKAAPKNHRQQKNFDRTVSTRR